MDEVYRKAQGYAQEFAHVRKMLLDSARRNDEFVSYYEKEYNSFVLKLDAGFSKPHAFPKYKVPNLVTTAKLRTTSMARPACWDGSYPSRNFEMYEFRESVEVIVTMKLKADKTRKALIRVFIAFPGRNESQRVHEVSGLVFMESPQLWFVLARVAYARCTGPSEVVIRGIAEPIGVGGIALLAERIKLQNPDLPSLRILLFEHPDLPERWTLPRIAGNGRHVGSRIYKSGDSVWFVRVIRDCGVVRRVNARAAPGDSVTFDIIRESRKSGDLITYSTKVAAIARAAEAIRNKGNMYLYSDSLGREWSGMNRYDMSLTWGFEGADYTEHGPFIYFRESGFEGLWHKMRLPGGGTGKTGCQMFDELGPTDKKIVIIKMLNTDPPLRYIEECEELYSHLKSNYLDLVLELADHSLELVTQVMDRKSDQEEDDY